jgi:hypothetical protein
LSSNNIVSFEKLIAFAKLIVGASFTGLIVILIVPSLVIFFSTDVTETVNWSVPLKLDRGVYEIVPAAFRFKVPLVVLVLILYLKVDGSLAVIFKLPLKLLSSSTLNEFKPIEIANGTDGKPPPSLPSPPPPPPPHEANINNIDNKYIYFIEKQYISRSKKKGSHKAPFLIINYIF